MRGFSFFLFLLFHNSIFACELNKSFDYYSLSGPISMLLEKFEVLNGKPLKAISTFHPVKDFQGKRLGGGIFLSPKVFSDPSRSIVFYDESRELARNLSQVENLKAIEVKTRELDVFTATNVTVEILKPYLMNCEIKISQLSKEITRIQEKLGKSKIQNDHILFFVDKIKEKAKKPKLLIVQDGFVLTLLKAKKIQTYDSPLAYVPWSEKAMKNKYQDYLNFGLENFNGDGLKLAQIDKNIYNIGYRGILIPGISQMYFLEEFLGIKYEN